MKNFRTILAALLMLCCATLSAHDFEVDGIYYNITGAKTVEVTYGGTSYSSAKSYSGSVTIPSSVTYNGTTYSVTTIGKLAFYGCSNLTSITIPNSVTTIEPAAFEHCRSLTSIEIPNGVTIIAGETFYACASLRRIEIPNSITTIETWAFNGCSSLKSIEIPNTVTTIGEGAFIGCYGLTNITVDENNLAYDSRNNCNAIIETASNTLVSGCQTTIIPNSVTAIGNFAFSDCKSLASIEIPNTVTTIGYWAFASCSSLKSIEIPNTVTTIGENTFSDCSSLKSIEIPNTVTTIGNSAFSGCSSLTSIVIPGSVTTIGDWTFSSCSSLTSISVAAGNTTYDSRDNCNAIIETASNTLISGCKNTVIPSSVTTIGYGAFHGCTSPSIVIPNSVTTIGDYAFKDCSSLTSITSYITADKLIVPGRYAFSGIDKNNCTLYVPAGAKETYAATEGWSEFRNIFELSGECGENAYWKFDTKNSTLTIYGEGATYDYQSAESPWNDFKREIKSIEIESGITAIGDYTIYGCTEATSISIPNTVTKIGDYGIYQLWNLQSLTIPNSVTEVGEFAFATLVSIEEIHIPASLASIGASAFGGCNSLETITVDSSNPYYNSNNNCNAIIETATNALIMGCKNTIIPDNVTKIGKHAFTQLGVGPVATGGPTSITIPAGVTEIGDYAFSQCSKLETVISHIPADRLFTPGYQAFNDLHPNCTLYVPASAKETYAATEGWSEFRNIFELSGECGENAYWKFDTKNSTLTIYGEGATYDYQSAESPWNDFKREIKSIEIESGITAIGDYTIYGCTEATSISIPNTVTKIGDYGIYQLWNLQSLTIPNSVTEVGEFAFATLVSIEEIHIPASLASIGASAFGGCNSLETITVDSSNPYYNSNNNCNAIIETATNALIMGCKNTIIPDNVTKIGKHAFTQLGVGPVATGGPTSITIPAGVTEIGDYAFSQCSKLETVISHIPADRLFTPGYQAFNDLHPNCTLYVPAGAKETYAATEGWNEFTNIVEIIENPFELTVSAAGYATLYLDYNAIIPEGVEVYTANTVDGNRLMMQQVTGTLPANTGVIVRAEQGTYTFELSFDEAEAIESNLFRGSVEDEYVTPEKNAKYYVLSMKDGVVGMYADALTGGTFKNNAHKAYLVLSPKIGIYDEEVDTEDPGMQLSNSYYFDFGGTTAIDPVVTECEENVYYDLNGRRVENPTRGIYILNGKKILVK